MNSENEEEHSDFEELEQVHELNKSGEAAGEEAMFNPKQGSIVIDEDGEKFLDCLSDEEEVTQIKTATPASKENEDQPNNQKEGANTSASDNKNMFKIKETKGKVVYDHATK